jgi:hypothetical protein
VHEDPVKYALWGLSLGLALALVCAVYIVVANGASRNLALGLGALVGAVVVFALQAVFELQGSSTTEDLYLEAIVDYQTKSIRSAQPSSYHSLIEAEASKILAGLSPALTQDDAPRIARDLAVSSVLSFLFGEQLDWQLSSATYKTASGEMRVWQGLSKPNECALFSIESVQEKLSKVGNMFAAAFPLGVPKKLCLPPTSTLDVTANSIIVTNRVCRLSIIFNEPFVSMDAYNPYDHQREIANLPNGTQRYRTVVLGARGTAEFFGLRAQARDVSKYQAWTKRVIDGLKRRFGNA